jgi:hypothetical protein
MSAIFKMAAKMRHKIWAVKIQHCPISIFITPPSFMKFCPVVPEICLGQVHVPKKERRIKRRIRIRINPMGKLKFRTLILITFKWIMIET